MNGLIPKFETYNLKNKTYNILDKTPNSVYFNAFNISNLEYGNGRHAFTLYGSDKLLKSSEVYIEIIDSEGNGIKCRGAKTKVSNPGWYIWFEINDSIKNGAATIYIAGTSKEGNKKWGGFDNLDVLWKKEILINKNLLNGSKLVFMDKPYFGFVKENIEVDPDNPLDVRSYLQTEIRDLEVYSGKIDTLEIYYKSIQDASSAPKNFITNGFFSHDGFMTDTGQPTGWVLSEVNKTGFNWDRSMFNSDIDTNHPDSHYLITPKGGASGIITSSLTQDSYNLLEPGDYTLNFLAETSINPIGDYSISVNVLTKDKLDSNEWTIDETIIIPSSSISSDWQEIEETITIQYTNQDDDYKPGKLQFIFRPPTGGEIHIDNIVFFKQLTDIQSNNLIEQNNENLLESISHFTYKGFFEGWERSELDLPYQWSIGPNSSFDPDKDSDSIKGPDKPFNVDDEHTITTIDSLYVLREKYLFNLDSLVENYYGSGKIRILKYNKLSDTTEIWKEETFQVSSDWVQISKEFDLTDADKPLTEIKIQIVVHSDDTYRMCIDNVQFRRNTFSYTTTDDKWKLLSKENITPYVLDSYILKNQIPDNYLGKILSFKILIKDDLDRYARTFNNDILTIVKEHVKFSSISTFLNSPVIAGNGLLTGSMYLSNVLYSGLEFGGTNSGFIRTVDYPGFEKSLMGPNAILGPVSGSISGSISSSLNTGYVSGSFVGFLNSASIKWPPYPSSSITGSATGSHTAYSQYYFYSGSNWYSSSLNLVTSSYNWDYQYYSGSISSSFINGGLVGNLFGFITGSVDGYSETYDQFPDDPSNYRFPWMALSQKESKKGHNGFMLWSGSVMPETTDNYNGVGIELIADSSSYLRFRTSPSELDIRAKAFYVGDPNTQFISGSGGNIEISSSAFHLSGGNLILQGTGSFGAGEIGGWKIYKNSIESPNFRPASGSIGINLASTGSIEIISGSDGIIIQASGSKIYSKNYVPLQQGMYLNPHFAEFGNVRIRGELRTAVFKKDLITVSNGYLLVTDSSVLSSSLNPDEQWIQIKDNAFETGDILHLKDFQNNNIEQEYMRVISGSGDIDIDSIPSYVNVDFSSSYAVLVERNYESNFWESGQYFTGSVWEPGTAIAVKGNLNNIESGGNGFLFFDASSEYSPYMDVTIRTGSAPEEGLQTKVRLGRLSGINDEDVGLTLDNNQYGLYTDNAYLKGGIVANFGNIGGWEITTSSIEKIFDETNNKKIVFESNDINNSSSIYFGNGNQKSINITNNKNLTPENIEIPFTNFSINNANFSEGDLTYWSASNTDITTDVSVITSDNYYKDGDWTIPATEYNLLPYSGSYFLRIMTVNNPIQIPYTDYFYNMWQNEEVNTTITKIIDISSIGTKRKISLLFNFMGSDAKVYSNSGNTGQAGWHHKLNCKVYSSEDGITFNSTTKAEQNNLTTDGQQWRETKLDFVKEENENFIKLEIDVRLWSFYNGTSYIWRGKVFLDNLRLKYSTNSTIISPDGILIYSTDTDFIKLTPYGSEIKLDSATLLNVTASNLYIDNDITISKGTIGSFNVLGNGINYLSPNNYNFGLDTDTQNLYIRHTSSISPELIVGNSINSFDSIISGSNGTDITNDFNNMNFSYVNGLNYWDNISQENLTIEPDTTNTIKFYVNDFTPIVDFGSYYKSGSLYREFSVKDKVVKDDILNININGWGSEEIQNSKINNLINIKVEGKLKDESSYNTILYQKNNIKVYNTTPQIFNITFIVPNFLENIKITITPKVEYLVIKNRLFARGSIYLDYITISYDRKKLMVTNEGLLSYQSPNKYFKINEEGLDFPGNYDGLINKKYIKMLEDFAENMLLPGYQSGFNGTGSLFYYDYENGESIIEVDRINSRITTKDGSELYQTIRGIGGTVCLSSRGTIRAFDRRPEIDR